MNRRQFLSAGAAFPLAVAIPFAAAGPAFASWPTARDWPKPSRGCEWRREWRDGMECIYMEHPSEAAMRAVEAILPARTGPRLYFWAFP